MAVKASIHDQIIDLMEQRDALVQSAEDLIQRATVENRNLTDKDQVEIDGITTRAEELGTQIEKLQREQDRVEKVNALRGSLNGGGERRATPNSRFMVPASDTGSDSDSASSRDDVNVLSGYRCRSLRSFESTAKGFSEAYDAGLYLGAVCGNQRCLRMAQNRGIITRANSLTAADGGYLTPAPLAAAIIKLVNTYGVARRLCQIIPMSSDTLDHPKMATGMTAAWTAEATAISASSATFSLVTLTAKKLAAYCLMSSEVAEDALIDLADWVTEEAARQISYGEDYAWLYGDGTATYGSINGICALYETAEAGTPLVGKVDAAGNLITETTVANVGQVASVLNAYAKMNATWVMSASYADYIMNVMGTAFGGSSGQDLQQTPARTLFGRPVVTSEIMPSSLSADNEDKVMALFGDFRQVSLFGDRRRMTMAVSEHIKFAEDQIALKVTERIQIQNHAVGTTSAAGSVIALIGGA